MLVEVQAGEYKLGQVWQVQRLQASNVGRRGQVWEALKPDTACKPRTTYTLCRRTTAWCGLLR